MFGRIRAAAGNIANRVRSAFSRSRGSSSGRSSYQRGHPGAALAVAPFPSENDNR